MVMPTDGNNKESIFQPSEWDYNERVRFCQLILDVKPRSDWITTEFGGYVRIGPECELFSPCPSYSNTNIKFWVLYCRILKAF